MKIQKSSKLSSKIDVWKTSRAERLHNYYGLKKSRFAKSDFAGCFVDAVWRHLCDFGCRFGPRWISEGGPKIDFSAIMLEKN